MNKIETIIAAMITANNFHVDTGGYRGDDAILERTNGGCATSTRAEYTHIFTKFERNNFSLIDTRIATREEINNVLAEILEQYNIRNKGEDSKIPLLEMLTRLHREISTVFAKKAEIVKGVLSPKEIRF